MNSPITSILRKVHRDKTKLNIVIAPTHESYETGLARTGHSFYAVRGENIKDWNRKFRPVPSNYTLLAPNTGIETIPWVDFDLALSMNKWGQFPALSQIARHLGIPLISLEHTLPAPGVGEGYLQHMNSMRGDINLFISDFSRKAWGWSPEDAEVIHHGIDTELFKPSNDNIDNVILSVVNDWINRDMWCNFQGWQRITQGLPVKVLGDTPGLSKAAESTDELVKAYQSSRIFLNTSTVSPVPTSLMEAMAVGCACVSTATCMIPSIIESGKNGLISNNESELRAYCIELLKDEKLAKRLGDAARQTIIERFSLEKFVENWNNIFKKAINL